MAFSNDFDLRLSHAASKTLVENHGMDAFLAFLQVLYPEKELYAVSKDWLINRFYCCKSRGTKGDLLIGWEENK